MEPGKLTNPPDWLSTSTDFRYGTTTCAVAAAQNNSGLVVSVEPDPRVWWVGEANKVPVQEHIAPAV